jgi:Right handed beta helix region
MNFRWLSAFLMISVYAMGANENKSVPCDADLCVGPTRKLQKPSDAAALAKDGDNIKIDAGDYVGDAALWTKNDLTISAVNGRAHMIAAGVDYGGKGTWVIKGANTTVENLEFSGAKVRDRNGAGIRFEGKKLTVRNCYFHHNENGILGGLNEDGEVLVENSEFAYNGFGDGQSHNIYIGRIRSLTVRFSYLHHAIVGHNLKSRARTNHVLYNRIVDENDGRASYEVNLPEGGLAYLIGNTIQQSPKTENNTIVAYGEEALRSAPHEFYFASNTVINSGPADSRFIRLQPGAAPGLIVNNIFSGPGKILDGLGELRNNVVLGKSDFKAASEYDFRLNPKSSGIDAGADPGEARGISLAPTFEYVHPLQSVPRKRHGRLDLGAYEQ